MRTLLEDHSLETLALRERTTSDLLHTLWNEHFLHLSPSKTAHVDPLRPFCHPELLALESVPHSFGRQDLFWAEVSGLGDDGVLGEGIIIEESDAGGESDSG